LQLLKSIIITAANAEVVFDEVLPLADSPYLGIRYSHSGTATLYIDDFAYFHRLAVCWLHLNCKFLSDNF